MSSETESVTAEPSTFKVALPPPVIVCVVGESVAIIDAERVEAVIFVVRVGFMPALILMGETPPVLIELMASRKEPAPESAELVTNTVASNDKALKLK